MKVVIPRAQRADLQLMSDGKRVNWKLVSYLTVMSIDGKDGKDGKDEEGLKFTFQWKYKASIKTESTKWTGVHLDAIKHFRPFNIVEFKDNLFINLNRILFIEEEAVHGPVEKTRVKIVFEDGISLTEVFKATGWAWWKTTFL